MRKATNLGDDETSINNRKQETPYKNKLEYIGSIYCPDFRTSLDNYDSHQSE
jgi:hypothetical protein